MQLRDRGLLRLDDPVVKYVPELRAVHDPFGPVDAITIRHLMSHSAGFRNPTWPWTADRPDHAGQDWLPFEPTQWSQLVSMMPYTEVMFAPGTRYSYSNLGVVFLGQIIEHLTGDPFQVYIDKNILKPLEMYSSYFDQSPYFLLKHRAAGYYRTKGLITPAPFNFHTGITVSNGGLNAPIPDMVKYLNFLLGGAGNQVLGRGSLEEMWRKQLPAEFPGESICLSFFAYDAGDRQYIGHSGQQGGFISHFFIDPEGHSAYIVAYNTDIAEANPDRDLTKYRLEKVFPSLRRARTLNLTSQP
jgi:CubicO group peptidase (beta-lactamase class C family)